MRRSVARDGGEESNSMPVNGAAVNGAEAASPDRPPLPESKGPRGRTEAKEGSGKQSRPRRRRGAKEEFANTKSEERFFLAAPDGGGGAPALGRECASEAEAIIESFRSKLNFYKISEFQTRADIEPSGDPVLRKEVVRSNHHPAS
jgi:hypothetical protein